MHGRGPAPPWVCVGSLCVMLCVQTEWGMCIAPWGRSSLSWGGGGVSDGGVFTLFSHPGVQLHLSVAPPVQVPPPPLPSSAVMPDFPRCLFPLC